MKHVTTNGRVGLGGAAALCGALAGCQQPPDPCADKSESCLAVQIEVDEATAKSTPVDRVRALFSIDDGPRRERAFAAAGAAEASLPIAFPLLLGAQGGAVKLDVIAERRQTPALLGAGQEAVGPGEHKRLVLSLSPDVSSLPTAGPPPRRDAGLVPIPGSSPAVVLLFGGLDADGQPRGDTWEYRTASGGFVPIPPGPGGAPVLRVPTMCPDPVGHRVLLIQGGGPLGMPLSDLWQYAAGPGWSPLPSLRGPSPPRLGARCAVTREMMAPMRDLALLFGGQESPTAPALTDLLAAPLPAGPSLMGTGATLPNALRSAQLVSDLSGAYLIGTEEGTAAPLKVWRLDLATPRWVELNADTTSAPGRRTGFAAALDPQGTQLFVFGGRSEAGALQRDLYSFNLTSPGWTLISTTQQPSPREGASLAAVEGTLLLFGGQGGEQPGGALATDHWKLVGGDWQPL